MLKLIVVVTCYLLSIISISQAGGPLYTLTPEDEKQVAECATENGVDPAAWEGKTEEELTKMFMEKNHKCFVKCLIVKGGVMNEEGKMDYEKLKEQMKKHSNDEKTFELIKSCAEENQDKKIDLCDKVFEIQACVMAKAKM